jgi:M6 family metalloprotease-like protein
MSAAHSQRPALARLALPALLLLHACTQPLAVAESLPQAGATRASDVDQAIAWTILHDTAVALGWPETVSPRPDLPGQAMQVAGHGASGSLSAAISVAPQAEDEALLDRLLAEGLSSGLFHGRHAVILHPGDPFPLAGPVTAPGDGAAAARSTRGLVAWRCGPYTLVASDDAGSGGEGDLAEAFFAAAEQHNLCGLPASLVILAQTADMPGGDPLLPRTMSEMAQRYYDANGYGRVDLAFTVLDADGPAGDHDWFTVGPEIAAYAGQADAYALAAVRQAGIWLHPGRQAYVERAIVVCPAGAYSLLAGSPAAVTISRPGGAAHQVDLPGTPGGRIAVSDLVLLPEGAHLGNWVHELGHTLPCRYPSTGGHDRLSDRYDYGPSGPNFGDVGYWDLMGEGNKKGAQHGMSPSQMSSYTKEAAGWLRYAVVELGQVYTLTALESQHMGDAALTFDDPLSDDPRGFYVIEGRDREASFGAPASGVIVYQVAYDGLADYAVVTKLPKPPHPSADWPMSEARLRPTLFGSGRSGGQRRVEIPGGICVTLLAESISPYRATIRVERCDPGVPDLR